MFGTNTPGIRFAHRDPNGDPEKLKKYVGDVVNELIALEQSTDPSGGKETSKNKDYDASRALQIVGKLVESLAGWAIDHQIGLGIEERYSVHLSSIAIEQHPELLPAVAAANDHRHEAAGSEYVDRAIAEGQKASPHIRRQMMINLLSALSNAFPHSLVYETILALESLEYGEVQPLFTPIKKNLGDHGFSAWNLRLSALESVEYFAARGYSRMAAQQKVGDAFGRDLETVRDWQKNVRSRLGDFKVARCLALAWTVGKKAEAAKRKGNWQNVRRCACRVHCSLRSRG